jgi:hypothetical protein
MPSWHPKEQFYHSAIPRSRMTLSDGGGDGGDNDDDDDDNSINSSDSQGIHFLVSSTKFYYRAH